mmetsp:Transcript_12362/g.32133  ORF Transcript_12362/g.32133 Transcript_12362/m.32133 type:complete len:528 (+) Transcript_12362:146-1729(+)
MLSLDNHSMAFTSTQTPDGGVEIDGSPLGLLGCGAHGSVYVGRDLKTGETVAVKVSSVAAAAKSSFKEITVLAARLPAHPHVVQLRSAQVDVVTGQLYLVLELCQGGELFDRIAEVGGLPEPDARSYFLQILSAIDHCHSAGVFHCDLKPENILLDINSHVKVADFGLASTRHEQGGLGDLKHTACGSISYAAPELYESVDGGPPKGYVPEYADIWSLGVVLYCMLTARLPFTVAHPELCERYAAVAREGIRIMCTDTMSADALGILALMLEPRPELRPSAKELMKHPWLTGVKLPFPEPSSISAPPSPMHTTDAPPKWSSYDIYELQADGTKAWRAEVTREACAAQTWDLLAPISMEQADGGSPKSHKSGEITPPAQPEPTNKRQRMSECPGTNDLVRHLGWERLDASAVDLMGNVLAALDKLGVKYTLDRRTSSVALPPTAALNLSEGESVGELETRLAEITIRLLPTPGKDTESQLDFIRTGGCTIAFHSLYRAFREQMVTVNGWHEHARLYELPAVQMPSLTA